MSWRTAATVLIVIFGVVLVQAVVAGPLKDYQDSVNDTGTYDNTGHFNGSEIIQNTVSSWFDMGLVAIFGIMGWGLARVVRRELTRRSR